MQHRMSLHQVKLTRVEVFLSVILLLTGPAQQSSHALKLCKEEPKLCDETFLIEYREQGPDHERFHSVPFSPCENALEKCVICDQPGVTQRINTVSCSDKTDCYWTERSIDISLSKESLAKHPPDEFYRVDMEMGYTCENTSYSMPIQVKLNVLRIQLMVDSINQTSVSHPDTLHFSCYVHVHGPASDLEIQIYLAELTIRNCTKTETNDMKIRECYLPLSEVSDGESYCQVIINDVQPSDQAIYEFYSEKMYLKSLTGQDQDSYYSRFIFTVPSVGGFLLLVAIITLIALVVVTFKWRRLRHQILGYAPLAGANMAQREEAVEEQGGQDQQAHFDNRHLEQEVAGALDAGGRVSGNESDGSAVLSLASRRSGASNQSSRPDDGASLVEDSNLDSERANA